MVINSEELDKIADFNQCTACGTRPMIDLYEPDNAKILCNCRHLIVNSNESITQSADRWNKFIMDVTTEELYW